MSNYRWGIREEQDESKSMDPGNEILLSGEVAQVVLELGCTNEIHKCLEIDLKKTLCGNS
jgi:hypothetical protein